MTAESGAPASPHQRPQVLLVARVLHGALCPLILLNEHESVDFRSNLDSHSRVVDLYLGGGESRRGE